MGVLDLVFPKTCLGCGREGAYLCASCVAKVRLAKPVCPNCERPSIDGITHVKCLKKHGLDGLISIWEYEGIVRKAIMALKYEYALEVGRELCGNFAEYIKNSSYFMPKSGVLVPVPIYWYRENTRGFNQSVEVGRAIASQMGWKFLPDLLIRSKSTTPQTKLSGEARRQNLKGVFLVNPNYTLNAVPSTLVLFDDVFTTGSTLKEACKVLKRGGAKKVWGLTMAR